MNLWQNKKSYWNHGLCSWTGRPVWTVLKRTDTNESGRSRIHICHEVQQVPRSENKKANALSKIASTSFAHLSKQVLVEELKEKSIEAKEVLAVVEEEGYTWMTPIYEYLIEEVLLEDKKKARAIRRKAARKLIRECNDYQVHYLIPRNPQQTLTPITSLWPFYKWGIDIARPFPEANGLVERANRSLGEGIKARLDERRNDWMGELSHVLWAHRTMIKSSNGETSFSVTYGTEAVIPVEIGMLTRRTAKVDMIQNDEALEINLDLVEEKKRTCSNTGSEKQS
ncbi:reverse transcriptase domain-containing protein [Tanacetum coccineum]